MTDIQAMTDAREALENAASDFRREAIRHETRAKACRESAAEAQRAADTFDRVIVASINAPYRVAAE